MPARTRFAGLRNINSVGPDTAVPKVSAADLDHEALFRVRRDAPAQVIRKAMRHEPTIEWLPENQDWSRTTSTDLGFRATYASHGTIRYAWNAVSGGGGEARVGRVCPSATSLQDECPRVTIPKKICPRRPGSTGQSLWPQIRTL